MPDDNKKPTYVSRTDFEAAIVKRAWADPQYKKRLLANPRAVFEEELRKYRADAKLPENIQFYVHEETPNAMHMTLPMNPAEYGQLTGDEWMDGATGGFIAIVVAVAVTAAGVVNVAGAINSVAAGNVTVTGNVAINANASLNVNVG